MGKDEAVRRYLISAKGDRAILYLANGVHSLNYQILKEGRDYQFSRSLKPLEKHRDVITPISGLYHPGAIGHHHGCISTWLTGGKLGPTDRNTISIDQKMAEVTAQHTRISSMEIALSMALLLAPLAALHAADAPKQKPNIARPMKPTTSRPARLKVQLWLLRICIFISTTAGRISHSLCRHTRG